MKIGINKVVNNKYRFLENIGEGGMGLVYKALNLETNKLVAFKMLKEKVTSDYFEDIIRFKNEIAIISRLQHPNIVKIFDTGEYHGRPFLVMELLEGQDLSNILAEQKLTISETIKIICEITNALIYMHGHGVIHRDLKPGNIFMQRNGDRLEPKLLDFGLSLIMELKHITNEQEIAGTFSYMSPEATGISHGTVDERSDLYSLGVIFYRLLTGELPFKEKILDKLLHQQAALTPLRPGELNKEISSVLDEIVMKLLMKDPESRYQSARGLMHDLQRYTHGERKFTVAEQDQKIRLSYQTKLVGREAELAKVKEVLGKAAEGQGSVCLISGEAGIGKSRLVEEIRGYVYKQNGLFLRGRCLNHENKAPYHPFKETLDEFLLLFKQMEPDFRERETKRFQNQLGDLGNIILKFHPLMKDLISDTGKLVELEPERENQRFLMVLSDFFCGLTENGRVCVLFIDDLHWSDESSLNLLAEITKKIGKTNLLVLGAYRENEVSPEHKLTGIIKEAGVKNFSLVELKLNTLNDKSLDQLITGILGEKEGDISRISGYVLEKSHGNPFFAINILREMVEDKILTQYGSGWNTDWDKLYKMPVSDSMIDFILHRLKFLTEVQEDILYKASVIGREFEIKLISKLTNLNMEVLIGNLDQLISLQFIEKSPHKGRLLFLHDRIRDAFYAKLDPSAKQELHLSIAQVMEESNEKAIDNIIFDLVHHYLEVKDEKKVLQYVLPAAYKAKTAYANQEAIKYYNKGIRLIESFGDKGTPQWITANQDLIDVYLRIGEYEESIKLSKELTAYMQNNLDKAKLYKKIGLAYFKMGLWKLSEEYSQKALKLLGEVMPVGKSRTWLSIGREFLFHLLINSFPKSFFYKNTRKSREKDKEIVKVYLILNWGYINNDTNQLIYCVLRMFNIARLRIGKSTELAGSLDFYAALCMAISLFKSAHRYYHRGLALYTELQDEWGIAKSLQSIGCCYNWQGENEKSIEAFIQAEERFKKIGDIWELAFIYRNFAFDYYYLADYQKSFYYNAKFLEMSQKIRNDYDVSSSYENFLHFHIEIGDFKIAEEYAMKAQVINEAKNIVYNTFSVYLHLGYLEIERADYQKAIVYLEKARALKEEHQGTILENYSCYVYSLLAEAYIGQYRQEYLSLNQEERKMKLKRIKRYAVKGFKRTESWPNNHALALRVLANYYQLVKLNPKAERLLAQAIAHSKKIRKRYDEAKSYYDYGNILKSNNLLEEAELYWYKAYKVFTEIGAMEYSARCAGMLGMDVQKPVLPDTRERLRSERKLQTAIDTSRYISSILDINTLLEKIMDSTMELVGAERGLLMLYPENDNNSLEIKVSRNVAKDENFIVSQSIISRVKKERKPLIIADASVDELFRTQQSIVWQKIKSVLCAPVMIKGEILGLIYLDSSLLRGLFTDDDLEILNLIANQAGVSIENAKLYRKLQVYLQKIEESRDKLSKWNQKLEQRVAERTEQLEVLNEELNERNEELTVANKHLKDYASMVEELAVIKERNRLAMEIHDSLGQTMNVLLKLLENSEADHRTNPVKTGENITQAIEVVRDGLAELKHSVAGLVPGRLKNNDLLIALRDLFAVYEISGLEIEFITEGILGSITPTCAEAIYRVCQEAMTNSIKHGHALRVMITLRRTGDFLRLYIIDDGRGCNSIKKNHGLFNMEQRISKLQGSISYGSEGKGFNIFVEIPLKEGVVK